MTINRYNFTGSKFNLDLKKAFLTILVLFSLAGIISGQGHDSIRYWVGRIVDGDTIIERELDPIWVFPGREGRSRRLEARFWRYVYKVKKVYPYAKLANELLQKYEPQYFKLESKRERRKLMKQIEDELLAEYKDDLKKMSLSEGRILIKLIDRETSRTSYMLIKEFRGGFSAFFWQTIARLFKNDLKSEYDPEGEDRLTEEIVRMIENGQI